MEKKIRVLGRLITNQPISASDHGFQLSTSEDFSSPILVSLGIKEGPGRFIGETAGLAINQRYFVRAFASVDGVELVGETIEIQTLSPVIESYEPTFAKAGEEIIIQGRNLPDGTRVFFLGTRKQRSYKTFLSPD
ncbi:IPT/TIG domain-containing protein [Algoriphagus boritolerans]|uniref:IPT/TIG domain-containing protein n=1 Tax=Algoriphagus boritolerans TaxID=308111 RepID=UPI000AB98431